MSRFDRTPPVRRWVLHLLGLAPWALSAVLMAWFIAEVMGFLR